MSEVIDKLENEILKIKLDGRIVPDWMELQLDRAKNVKLAVEYLSDAVNGMDTKDVAQIMAETLTRQHRTLQQSVFRSIIDMMLYYSHLPDNYFDGRNEQVKLTCEQISNLDIYLPVI